MAVAVALPPEAANGVRLVDGARELRLVRPRFGIRKLDLGTPEVRDVVDGRTDRDGTDDRTAHHGARGIVIELVAVGDDLVSASDLIDQVRSFCHPASRPLLVLDGVDGQQRSVRLRADTNSAPMTRDDGPGRREAVLSWRAPEGVLKSLAVDTASVSAASPDGGLTFPLTFPWVFPGGGTGRLMVTVRGTAPASPVSRLFGPFGGPGVRTGWANETTGKRLEFVGLEVAAGDYVELNHAERTVRLNGLSDPGSNRYRFLDFAVSDWWSLLPGQVNTVRFYPDVFNVPAQALIDWSDTWL